MSRTASLREQHDELLVLASEIDAASARLDTDLDVECLLRLLGQFDTILSAHLAVEDRLLYPEMLASGDRKAAALASRFCEEMGGLTAAYAAFKERWNTSAALRAHGVAYRRDWAGLQSALAFRIQREDAELYPLADAADHLPGREAG